MSKNQTEAKECRLFSGLSKKAKLKIKFHKESLPLSKRFNNKKFTDFLKSQKTLLQQLQKRNQIHIKWGKSSIVLKITSKPAEKKIFT